MTIYASLNYRYPQLSHPYPKTNEADDSDREYLVVDTLAELSMTWLKPSTPASLALRRRIQRTEVSSMYPGTSLLPLRIRQNNAPGASPRRAIHCSMIGRTPCGR